ncbi:MAG TPA: S-layer homology domain-containing protein [Ruminiclostridium sp.]
MKKTILGVILAGVILLSSTFTFAQTPVQEVGTIAALSYTDISGHWSNGAVQNLAKMGAIPFSGDKFIPGKAITRSEFVVMLHSALEIQIEYFKAPDIKDYFDDVKQDATYATALIDLVTANIIEGKGSFNPNATLSREEMIHYIMNAYKYEFGDVFAYIKIKGGYFTDHNEITPIYSGDVDYAAYSKLIVGAGKNLFHPMASATRAEAAVVINKLLDIIDTKKPDVTIKADATLKADALEMKLSIVNNSKKAITINRTSGQDYDFALLDADRNSIYSWSANKSFMMVLTSSVIEAGKSVDYSETLNGDEFNAIKDKAVYLKAYVVGSSDSFIINADGYEVTLK